MDLELISFLRARLDADEHNVVAVQALAPTGVDVLLDSTVPMLDGMRAVVEAYARAVGRESGGVDGHDVFTLGRAAGLEEAVRHLASIYHGEPGFQARWRPGQRPEGSGT
ncbi:hypothetical protein KDL01_28570 [Actinospica durhamensis]|uniref:Uncharacterized protein n=1 Tax=Actinospica durhamensis TaxID=1508375 RepID=A0A941IVI5_9ACTN|nr:DUF6221 family protein [Actinospica durhamensis]MBR7837266.1 hypothetical protein [Actinospica durhamensis]